MSESGAIIMSRPWVMQQICREVVFLHWPVRDEWLRPFIPLELDIDLYEGEAWIGLVAYVADQTRPRFFPPTPIMRTFRELNVRTYVRHRGCSGVFFFSLDADSALAVKVAGTGGFLPYRHAQMKWVKKGERRLFLSRYSSDDGGARNFRMGYTPIHGILKTSAFEHWLTERYCLWTQPKKSLWRVDIDHTPWHLQNVHIDIQENSLAAFLPINLEEQKPIAHFSEMKTMRFYSPVLESAQKADHSR